MGEEIGRLADQLSGLQAEDGTWRFCFENAVSTDAYMIIVLRTLEIADEPLIRRLRDRLLAAQHADGSWRVYPDEDEGNLSATVECYYSLLYSGYNRESDPPLAKAKKFILSKGGLQNISGVLTRVILAATGQYPWHPSHMIPLEFILLPSSFPISIFDFSGFARVHIVPILVLADRQFSIRTNLTPDLSELKVNRSGNAVGFFDDRIGNFAGIPRQLHADAIKRAERFMLERIEPDGTFYSYATCTILMIFALLSIGYDKRHPTISNAVQGLRSMLCRSGQQIFLQNSPSTVWDTALLSHALQEAGVPVDGQVIRASTSYILSKQHRKFGDWKIRNPKTIPGGWGFSDSNTLNPDVDDTTAALRAIKNRTAADTSYRQAWNRGLNWVLSMQNDDGGWPAFEKNTDQELLTLLPMKEAKSAAIDPSTADLTGRTLEFLGNSAGLGSRHSFIRKGTDWLTNRQEKDGSWYGRWGVCYIYGTWAALTGLTSVGVNGDNSAVRKGTRWLLTVQNADGGWGESCKSDRMMHYTPLGESTPSQTAWALDALIAVHASPVPEMNKGVQRLISLLHEENWRTAYPTGAGLPGIFYSHYHSYRYIWPLLALSHYKNKYCV
ncbi:squalene-hopene cyclase [Cohnella kolymensis]|uniref:Squalene-hopene cyclase n=1 Tax=Cohnella kolymensis TaxID=1590652 RepID=A0ABR5A0D8_9BACL|nr:squalene-hopene cyclase [Cohnella kolymensis]